MKSQMMTTRNKALKKDTRSKLLSKRASDLKFLNVLCLLRLKLKYSTIQSKFGGVLRQSFLNLEFLPTNKHFAGLTITERSVGT